MAVAVSRGTQEATSQSTRRHSQAKKQGSKQMNKSPDIRIFVLAATIALLTAGCAPAPSGGDARAAIEAQSAKWQESFNAGDGAGIAALYTDDGQILPPGAATVSGRENIAAFWQEALSAGGISATLETVEVVTQGNHATEVGRFSMTDADGNTVEQGKYLILWRQEQGEWRLARDIWNSDGAPAAEAAASSGNPLIDEALSAAPPSIAATATVVDWEGNVLREGSGGYTCLPTAPEMPGTAPMCMDQPWMAWGEAWQNRSEVSIDRVGISYMLAGDDGGSNTDPYAEGPTDDNEWVVSGPHLMVIVPDLALLEGIPTDPKTGGPFIMWKGTPYAHIMVPVGD
jgi:uncharacterized protein (TIGR02246 family)